MRISKLIAGLLLICFSAYVGHNLVPHHHHAEVYQGPIDTDCPFEHGDHQGHDQQDSDIPAEGHPLHCHAFNDVVFKKYTAPLLRPWTESIQLMTAPGQFKVAEQNQSVSPHRFMVLSLPCRVAVLPGSGDLRAPPVLA